MKPHMLLLAAASLAVAITTQAEDVCRVVLFGGSSVFTSYLPEADKHHAVLQKALTEAYPGQSVQVSNWADNGEFIARYLLKGAYEKQRQPQAGMDIAIIRFGTNDQKRVRVAEYEAQLRKLIELLQKDFPGVAVFLETGIYIDPAHYVSDRNKTLSPYWEVSRKIATEAGFPLVDYFQAGQEETAAGRWDLRARRGLVLNAEQDAGKGADWFSNIHPNLAGVKLAVREELKAIKTRYPDKLPTNQIATQRSVEDEAFYSQWLNFSSDRLAVDKNKNPEKDLQDATR